MENVSQFNHHLLLWKPNQTIKSTHQALFHRHPLRIIVFNQLLKRENRLLLQTVPKKLKIWETQKAWTLLVPTYRILSLFLVRDLIHKTGFPVAHFQISLMKIPPKDIFLQTPPLLLQNKNRLQVRTVIKEVKIPWMTRHYSLKEIVCWKMLKENAYCVSLALPLIKKRNA